MHTSNCTKVQHRCVLLGCLKLSDGKNEVDQSIHSYARDVKQFLHSSIFTSHIGANPTCGPVFFRCRKRKKYYAYGITCDEAIIQKSLKARWFASELIHKKLYTKLDVLCVYEKNVKHCFSLALSIMHMGFAGKIR